MHYTFLLVGLLFGSTITALENPHSRAPKKPVRRALETKNAPRKRETATFLNSKTEKFAVNGSALPDVDFNLGESYAGTLSIDSNSSNENALWFWFFPSENPAAKKEITLWLNGGPGCSSLDGLLQEHGPFLWQSGTYSPIQNPYSWTNLTNMIYVDQPIGTGFSPAAKGAPAQIKSEVDVARDFMGFWKNLFDTFDLHGYKVYITGESYAGQYCPYIASAMLDEKDTKYFNVKGMQINDPSINHGDTLSSAPAVGYLNHYSDMFNLNATFMADINKAAETCGYNAFMEEALTFPPTGILPAAPNSSIPGCDVWDDITIASIFVNPCFNIYHIIDYCPFLWDELGFPSLGWGPNDYFNRSDVQKVLHAPPTNYVICGDDTLGLLDPGDASVPSGLGPLPSVIERTNNVLIGHGELDWLLIANGTLATIQNMTWHGKQGFQTAPPKTENFYVPYHKSLGDIIDETFNQPIPSVPQMDVAGAGLLGTYHTERGLTWSTVNHAGHEIPEYAPGAAYRQLEFLLGRIKNLGERGDYTTQTGNFTGTTPLGE